MLKRLKLLSFTEYIPVGRGLGALVTAAGLALGGTAIAQDYDSDTEYEWEAGEGIHEEEWYDPSDWFNEDDGLVDYEYDYYDSYYNRPYYNRDYNDYYDPYDPYYDRSYDPNVYDSDPYDYDPYSYNYRTDRYNSGSDYDSYNANYDSADSDYDPNNVTTWTSEDGSSYETIWYKESEFYDTANAGDNQRQRAQRDANRMRNAELRGELESWSRLDLSGQRDAHTLIRVRLDNGRSAIVNLGPNVEPSRLDLEQGDTVAVYGTKGRIDGRSVLMARNQGWRQGCHDEQLGSCAFGERSQS